MLTNVIIVSLFVSSRLGQATISAKAAKTAPQSTTLRFNQTSLLGTLPTQLGLLARVNGSFDLSYERITGTLPTQLGQLVLFEGDLSLIDNYLTGALPTQVRGVGVLTTTSSYHVFNKHT